MTDLTYSWGWDKDRRAVILVAESGYRPRVIASIHANWPEKTIDKLVAFLNEEMSSYEIYEEGK